MEETTPEEVKAEYDWNAVEGYERLWGWFGLTRASWLTVPRVLMHEMPEEWQGQMARLLEQFDEAFPNWIPGQLYVSMKVDGKYAQLPEPLCNYRHPRKGDLEQYRATSIRSGV